MSGSFLALDDITVRLGDKRILERVSIDFTTGMKTVILGPNGAGKSVLLRVCHGLLDASSGSVRWHRPRRQAMVFQRPILLRRSALANIEYGLALSGVAGAERKRRANESLARVGLSAIADRSARVLSGGEQQRVALARAWALAPEVLFLDEPSANLDPAAAQAVEAIIRAIHSDGTEIIMTTHNLGQARRLADRIVYVEAGRVLESTPVERFFGGPRTPEARAFLANELPTR